MEKKQIFSLRKLSIGLVSMSVASLIFLGQSVVSADSQFLVTENSAELELTSPIQSDSVGSDQAEESSPTVLAEDIEIATLLIGDSAENGQAIQSPLVSNPERVEIYEKDIQSPEVVKKLGLDTKTSPVEEVTDSRSLSDTLDKEVDPEAIVKKEQELALAKVSEYWEANSLYEVKEELNRQSEQGMDSYVVQWGDTLSTISAASNQTVTSLAQLNNIKNPDLIYTGQLLKGVIHQVKQVEVAGLELEKQLALKKAGGQWTLNSTDEVAKEIERQESVGLQDYVIQWGDTLSVISAVTGKSIQAIASENSIVNPNLIYTGQVLRGILRPIIRFAPSITHPESIEVPPSPAKQTSEEVVEDAIVNEEGFSEARIEKKELTRKEETKEPVSLVIPDVPKVKPDLGPKQPIHEMAKPIETAKEELQPTVVEESDQTKRVEAEIKIEEEFPKEDKPLEESKVEEQPIISDEEIMEGESYIRHLRKDSIVLDEETGIGFVGDELIISTPDGVGRKTVEDIIRPLGLSIVGHLVEADYYQVGFETKKSKAELEQIISQLTQNVNIRTADLNTIIETVNDNTAIGVVSVLPTTSFTAFSSDEGLAVPNDPFNGMIEDWNEDKPMGANWGLEVIKARKAWKILSDKRNGKVVDDKLTIGVVESYIQTWHEDLNLINKMPMEYHISDPLIINSIKNKDHGMHVAGIIGAKKDNQFGIVGVAPNVRILDYSLALVNNNKNKENLEEYSNFEEFFLFNKLITEDAKIINYSRGHIPDSMARLLKNEANIRNIATERAKVAAKYFEKMLEKGRDFLIITAAGNYNNDIFKKNAGGQYEIIGTLTEESNRIDSQWASDLNKITPDINSEVHGRIIVVGSIDNDTWGNEDYKVSDFSNTGARVDLVAPGGTSVKQKIFSLATGNQFTYMEGTSMAAPYVSGIAALVWSANPNLTARQVKKIIIESAKDRMSRVRDDLRYPIANAERAVQMAFETIGVYPNIQNPNFEEGEKVPAFWNRQGDVRTVRNLGSLKTKSGKRMAILTTGYGKYEDNFLQNGAVSVLQQQFLVPETASHLEFDYNMVSEEPMEYFNSSYDDKFTTSLELIDDQDEVLLVTKSVNTEEWKEISGIDFPDGDNTTYEIGWKTQKLDISKFRGKAVELKFMVEDIGDSAFDTAVLIDNIRFV